MTGNFHIIDFEENLIATIPYVPKKKSNRTLSIVPDEQENLEIIAEAARITREGFRLDNGNNNFTFYSRYGIKEVSFVETFEETNVQ